MVKYPLSSVLSYETIPIADLCSSIIAEWAIARLQIEGARQDTLRADHKKFGDQDAKSASPPSDDSSLSAQDRSLKPIDGINLGATPTDEVSTVSAQGSYKCTSGKHSGRIFVTSNGIRFEAAVGSKDQWEMGYDNMHRVEKVRNSDPVPPPPN